MIADGRAVGAVVVEHRSRSIRRRRSAGRLGPRPAVLDRRAEPAQRRPAPPRPGPGRARRADRRRQPADVPAQPGARPRRRARAAQPDEITAVLFIDLDDFKVVNDSLGHAAGDALLQAVTERISASVRTGDLVARLGGDEFAVLTADAPDLKRSLAMAERLTRELRAPYLIGEHHVSVTASIGIASARDEHETRRRRRPQRRRRDVHGQGQRQGRLRGLRPGHARGDPRAPRARRPAPERGRARPAAACPTSRSSTSPTARLAGIEALVRWQHPERGLVAPGDFIEIAEENGSILPIGRWVLREACREAVSWSTIDPAAFLCVNVSAREIQQPGFVEAVARPSARRRHGRRPAQPGDHRDGPAQGHALDDRDARGPAPARRPRRHRRLRDRLLLAQPPAPVPGRHAQDRAASSCRSPRATRGPRPWPAPSSRWAARSRSRRSPRASRPPSRRRACATSAAPSGRASTSPDPPPASAVASGAFDRLGAAGGPGAAGRRGRSPSEPVFRAPFGGFARRPVVPRSAGRLRRSLRSRRRPVAGRSGTRRGRVPAARRASSRRPVRRRSARAR